MKRAGAAVALAIAALLPAAPACAHEPAAHAPAPAQATGHSRWGANYFPNVELVTQHGSTVRFYDDLLKGKSVAINFIFTDCKEVCPLETANLARLEKLLGERAGRDIHLYSISLDPEHDTPAVLKAYAEKFAANWTFLTGRPDDIKLIGRKLGMLRERDERAGSHHAAQLIVGDEPTGQWTRNSAVDNPGFLAARIATFLGWRDSAPQRSYAEARPLKMTDGERLFRSKCSACHTLGRGDKLGPDLQGVTARRSRAWLARYIRDPDQVLAAGDPIATGLFKKYRDVRMPNLRLGDSDVVELLSYLESHRVARR